MAFCAAPWQAIAKRPRVQVFPKNLDELPGLIVKERDWFHRDFRILDRCPGGFLYHGEWLYNPYLNKFWGVESDKPNALPQLLVITPRDLDDTRYLTFWK